MTNEYRLMSLLSSFLSYRAASVTGDMVRELADATGLSDAESYAMLFASAIGLDPYASGADRELFESYVKPALVVLDIDEFTGDPYYKTVRLESKRAGDWSLEQVWYEPYEAFNLGVEVKDAKGRLIPQIGYFKEPFGYPAIFQSGREWMAVKPSEIITMRPAVSSVSGRALAYGLGLGYFAFMASEKAGVSSVTVVERDKNAIELFTNGILPLFPNRGKIEIIEADAFDFARTRMIGGGYDFVFTDLWHDQSDGADLYLKMKSICDAAPGPKYMYWIEDTIKRYICQNL